MNNNKQAGSFFSDMLNKTKKDKIFIVILAGVLMMIIAMPVKRTSTVTDVGSSSFYDSGNSSENGLGKELEEMLGNTEGVGEVKVLVKLTDDNEVTGVMVVCEGGDDKNLVAYITDAINGLLGVPVHKIKVMKMSE